MTRRIGCYTQNLSSLHPSDRGVIFMGTTHFIATSITDNDIEKSKDVLAALVPTEMIQRHLISGLWVILSSTRRWFLSC
jgi:hypothetical protein